MSDVMICGNCNKIGIYWKGTIDNMHTYCPHCGGTNCQAPQAVTACNSCGNPVTEEELFACHGCGIELCCYCITNTEELCLTCLVDLGIEEIYPSLAESIGPKKRPLRKMVKKC